ncbi:MAG: acyltransferase [Octadecabacter sp.]
MYNASFHSREGLETFGFKSLGSNVLIHTSAVLVGCHNISLGDNVRIDPFTIISAGKLISIGSNVHIASNCLLAGAENIVLNDFVGLSHGVKVLSSSDDFAGGYLNGPTVPEEYRNVLSEPIEFGCHCIVGMNSVVMPGTRLGTGATIGALSLAKGNIAPWTMAAGVPTRKIGERDEARTLEKAAAYRTNQEKVESG